MNAKIFGKMTGYQERGATLHFFVSDDSANTMHCVLEKKDLLESVKRNRSLLEGLNLLCQGSLECKQGQKEPVLVVQTIMVTAEDVGKIQSSNGLPPYVEGIVAIER